MPAAKPQMKSARMCVYVDSNVFLQFQPLKQFDWSEFFDTDHVEFIVVPVVLRELSEKKNGEKRRLRERADASINMIMECVGEGLGGVLRARVSLRVHDKEPQINFASHGLNEKVNDDWIIAALIEEQAANAAVLSDDTELLLKLRGREKRGFRPPGHLKLEVDDPDAREIRELRKQIAQMQSRAPALSVEFADGGALLRATLEAVGPLPHDEIRQRVETIRREHLAAARITASRRAILGDKRIPIAQVFAGLTEPAAPFDEPTLENYLADYRSYLEKAHLLKDARARTVPIALVLRNSGAAQASAIHVQLEFPEGVNLLDDIDSIPEPQEPELPLYAQNRVARSMFGSPTNIDDMLATFRGEVGGRNRYFLAGGGRRVESWSLAARTAEIEIAQLNQGFRVPLPELFVTFPHWGNGRSGFRAQVRIGASELPAFSRSSLDFVASEG